MQHDRCSAYHKKQTAGQLNLSHGNKNRKNTEKLVPWRSTPLEWLSSSRDLDLDLGSGHTAYHHASLIDLYLHTKVHWNRKNFLWMDGRTDVPTDGHFRPPLMLLAWFGGVDLKTKTNIAQKKMVQVIVHEVSPEGRRESMVERICETGRLGWPQSRRKKFLESSRLLHSHNYTFPEVITTKILAVLQHLGRFLATFSPRMHRNGHFSWHSLGMVATPWDHTDPVLDCLPS